MMLWVYDVLLPALCRLRTRLDKCLPWLGWVLAAAVVLLSREHLAARVLFLGIYLFLQGRILKRCRRKDGSWPVPVYLSAFFPILMLHSGFLTLPLIWQGCILIWSKNQQ